MCIQNGDTHSDHHGCECAGKSSTQKAVTSRSIYLTVSQRTDAGIYWGPSRHAPPHLSFGIFIAPSDWQSQPQKVELALQCSLYEVIWKYQTYLLEASWQFNDLRICATWKKSLLGMIKMAEVPKRHNKRKNSMLAIRSMLEAIKRPKYDMPYEDSWCWIEEAIPSLQSCFKAMPQTLDYDALLNQCRNLGSRAISKELVRKQGAVPLGVFDINARREYEIRYKVKRSMKPAKLLIEVLEPGTTLCSQRTQSVLEMGTGLDGTEWDEKRPFLKKGRTWTFKKTEFS